VAGGALAVAGMASVAAAQDAAALAAGILVAGAASGLMYPPFADAVAQRMPAAARPRALAIISAGTGWGVLVSVPIALSAGGWRVAWVVFAALALLATVWAAIVLRGVPTAVPAPDRLRPSWFVCPRSGPLLAGAFLIGLGSSVYWTFAVDLVASEGDVAPGAARLVLALVGAASLAGSVSGELVERLGGRATFIAGSLALAASLALLAAAPGEWLAVVPSAILFGGAYNVVVAVDVIWSARVFAGRPATGLAAVMVMLGAGLLVGPAVAGAVGVMTAFFAGAAVIAATTLLTPAEDLAVSSA
jgi:predicted MFS family arabinose efflux permease